MIDSEHKFVLSRYALLGAAGVLSKVFAFAATVFVVRLFGDAAFGRVMFSSTVAMYAVMLAILGTDVYAVRRVARAPEKLGSMATTIILLRILVAIGVYGLLLGVVSLFASLRQERTLIALYGLSVFSGAFALTWVPQAVQRFHVLGAANLGTQAFYLLFLVSAASLFGDVWVVPVAQVAAEAVVAVGLLFWLKRFVTRFERPLPGRAWLEIVKESAPIGGARFLRMFSLGSDLVLLGILVSMSEVGWYGGAFKCFMLCVSMGALYFVILFPRLVGAAELSGSALAYNVAASQKRVLLGAVLVGGLLAFFARDILLLLFPEPFQAATRSLQILLLAWLVGLINGHYRNTLLAVGRQRLDVLIVALSSAGHVVFKLILIPRMGIDGAAIGTLLGEGLLMVLGWRATRNILRVGVNRSERTTPDGPAEA